MLPGLSPRERLLCMVAASVEDIDGLGILVSQDLYWDLHHKLGHCLAFGVLVATVVAARSTRRGLMFAAALGLFHLHLLMDFYGSGPGWGIYYLWPASDHELRTDAAWAFYSWQNIGTFAALLAWTVWIAVRHRRTPPEAIMPRLDRKLSRALRPRTGSSPDAGGGLR